MRGSTVQDAIRVPALPTIWARILRRDAGRPKNKVCASTYVLLQVEAFLGAVISPLLVTAHVRSRSCNYTPQYTFRNLGSQMLLQGDPGTC